MRFGMNQYTEPYAYISESGQPPIKDSSIVPRFHKLNLGRIRMKLIPYSVLFVCVAILGLSGCGYKTISHGTAISESEAADIKIGQTTKADIFMQFGEPSKMADKEHVFFYSWTRGHKAQFLGLGSGTSEGNTLVVIFDDDGIVKKYRITRGVATDVQAD